MKQEAAEAEKDPSSAEPETEPVEGAEATGISYSTYS